MIFILKAWWGIELVIYNGGIIMNADADAMRRKLNKAYDLAGCVSRFLNKELESDINNSIDDLIIRSKLNPSNKELLYEIDDLVALRDETLNKFRLCKSERFRN